MAGSGIGSGSGVGTGAGDAVASGYETPSITQFSVFLNNRCGRLLDLLETFQEEHIRLAAISIVDATDHAVVRLVTTCPSATEAVLEKHDIAFNQTDVLIVELDNHQTLTMLCTALLAAELNIHFTYPLIRGPHQKPTMALYCDDVYMAANILRKKQFSLLGEADLDDCDTDGDGAI